MTNQSRSRIASLYGRFCRIANSGQSAFLLLIRVYIGYQCVISGWSHLHNLDKTAQFFASLHIPAPKLNVVMSAMTEIVGGAMMALGLFARPAALVLTGNFIVAMLSVQLSNYDFSFSKLAAQIWSDQSPILGDTAFPFLATSIIVLLFGPGWFSVDGVLRRWCAGKGAQRP